MEYYRGALFPELKDKLVLALHGWQPGGHRIALFDTDKDGRPIKKKGQSIDQFLIKYWQAKAGIRPAGRPGGLMVDANAAASPAARIRIGFKRATTRHSEIPLTPDFRMVSIISGCR